jgi:hypothetical protein
MGIAWKEISVRTGFYAGLVISVIDFRLLSA